jgi:uncharacterized membrane protein (UPF0127 family)
MRAIFQLMITVPLLSVCLWGCSSEAIPNTISRLPSLVTEQGHRIRLEVADDFEERQQGLMFRTELDEDAGMIFVFTDESPRSFWMKNTLIPLDVVYISSELIIVDIKTMPPCGEQPICPSYPSQAASRYAVEMNAGTAGDLGMQVGDLISFENTSF